MDAARGCGQPVGELSVGCAQAPAATLPDDEDVDELVEVAELAEVDDVLDDDSLGVDVEDESPEPVDELFDSDFDPLVERLSVR